MTTEAPEMVTVARDVPGADTLSGAMRLFTRFSGVRLLLAKLAVLVVARLWVGGASVWDAAVLAGIAAYWPLQEWVLHRYVLHMRPRTVFGLRLDPAFARYHRYHHEHPWVLERTFLPLRVLVPLVPVNVLVWWALMPTLGSALTAMVGMTAAALVYEWTHYLTHTPYRPRSAYYRRIHKNHMLHHFQDEASFFAFTAPSVDHILGTDRPTSAPGS